MAEASDFKEKIRDAAVPLSNSDQHGANLGIANSSDDWDDIGIIMISEIKETTKLENVKIVCSVEAIDTNWGWYYFACKKCGKIVSRISRAAKPSFRCGVVCRTNVTKVFPKFKLYFIVGDVTGNCKLVLLGSIAQTLIGSEVTDIWDGSFEEEIETESEPVTLIEGASSSMSSGRVMLLEGVSRTSSGDCTTPGSKRKETGNDLLDITSCTKKTCTDPIKIEKSKTD
ncbi:hypothetical protein N665_0218s0089 [Sinapis alba]|nr:hypothetical protein N665_0218s0089 [Sinapis alba]